MYKIMTLDGFDDFEFVTQDMARYKARDLSSKKPNIEFTVTYGETKGGSFYAKHSIATYLNGMMIENFNLKN